MFVKTRELYVRVDIGRLHVKSVINRLKIHWNRLRTSDYYRASISAFAFYFDVISETGFSISFAN